VGNEVCDSKPSNELGCHGRIRREHTYIDRVISVVYANTALSSQPHSLGMSYVFACVLGILTVARGIGDEYKELWDGRGTLSVNVP
jgi:hypothetical protein